MNPYLLEDWDTKFSGNIASAIDICKSHNILKEGDRIILVNDIQKGEREIPIVELMEIS